jgi:hypothetical protein
MTRPNSAPRLIELDYPKPENADRRRKAPLASTSKTIFNMKPTASARKTSYRRCPAQIPREAATGETMLATCGCTHSRTAALCGHRTDHVFVAAGRRHRDERE